MERFTAHGCGRRGLSLWGLQASVMPIALRGQFSPTDGSALSLAEGHGEEDLRTNALHVTLQAGLITGEIIGFAG